MYTIDCTAKGTESRPALLMNRNPLPGEAEPVVKKTPGMREGMQNYMVDFEKSKYLTEDGKLYLPSTAIHRCLADAALNFQIPGKGKKTYKSLIVGSLMVEPDFIIHKIQECEPDRRWVRIKTARIVRTRAKLPKWEIDFSLVVTEDQLPEDALKQILEYAALTKGLGDYRPRFGQFMITKFQRRK